jgi:hypothetical protein
MDTQRIVIELHRGDEPIAGTFLAGSGARPTPFSGWIELLALFDTARALTRRQGEIEDGGSARTGGGSVHREGPPGPGCRTREIPDAGTPHPS